MFIGHYSAALALKAAEPKASLGMLFIGAQFADLLFFPFMMVGIEQMTIIPNYTESTHFRLDYLPYSHSLVAAILWSALVFGAAWLWLGKDNPRRKSISLVLAAAVASHWFLDVAVHTPDMPLLDGNGLKLGSGLWHSAPLTYLSEAVVILLGLWLYMRATRANAALTRTARAGMPLFVLALALANVINLYGPPPGSKLEQFAMAMVSYLVFTAVAFWLDRARTARGS